jgi:endonuclease/exonuclease/phosphatase family metal-dependent hydrolase
MTARIRMSALALALPLAAIPAALVPATADARRGDVTVMTRNLYVGVDLRRVIPPTTREEFEQAAADAYQRALGTDFPSRAKLIAREIARTDPDLVGLQEVVLIRRGPDGIKDGPTTPATAVVQDFLQLLRTELAARGLRYKVAQQNQNVDAEVPTALGYDVRVSDRDVILARSQRGLRLSGERGRTLKAAVDIKTAVGSIRFLRGFSSVDVRLNGASFRFVNTHVEAFAPATRDAQLAELTGRRGVTRTSRPVVLVGDTNSAPTQPLSSSTNATGYFSLIRKGFVDAWTRAKGRARGYTCCHAEDLLNPRPMFDERIDQIFTKPKVRVLDAEVVGDEANNRTARGHWPSDHAGVVAELRFPVR